MNPNPQPLNLQPQPRFDEWQAVSGLTRPELFKATPPPPAPSLSILSQSASGSNAQPPVPLPPCTTPARPCKVLGWGNGKNRLKSLTTVD